VGWGFESRPTKLLKSTVSPMKIANSVNTQRDALKRTETQSIWQVFVNGFVIPAAAKVTRHSPSNLVPPHSGHGAATSAKAARVKCFVCPQWAHFHDSDLCSATSSIFLRIESA